MPPLSRLWFKWKSLKLPWRKRWLAGMDLSGTTFWEFKDSLGSNRLRRIAQPDPKTHYSDVKVSPQWHQWLRHTREDPPSIFEQQMDVQRQLRLKDLARLADERWASKPSILDGPTAGTQSRPASLLRDAGLVAEAQTDVVENLGAGSEESGLLEGGQKSETRTRGNPWNVRTEGPGEQWQPQAWNPPAAVRR